jgi:hypothetical protein
VVELNILETIKKKFENLKHSWWCGAGIAGLYESVFILRATKMRWAEN